MTHTQADPPDTAISPTNLRAMPGRKRSVITVIGVAIGLASGFAPLYFGTIAVFLRPISEEFGWTRAQVSFGSVVSMLGVAFGSVAVGRLADRYGDLRVIAVGTLSMSALIIAQSRIEDSFGVYALLSLLIGFAGAATTPPGYMPILARSIRRRLGLALGFSGVGMGVGHIISPIAAQSLLEGLGWRGAYVSLALSSVCLGALAWILIFGMGMPRSTGTAQAGIADGHNVGMTLNRTLRHPSFHRLALMVLLVSTFTTGISIHLSAILQDRDFSASTAARAISLAGAGVLIGRIISGLLIDRYQARYVAAGFYLCAGLGAFMLVVQIDQLSPVLLLCAVLLGISMGAEGDLLPFFVRMHFGIKAFGATFGVLFFVHSIGGVAGPYLFGLGYDKWDSYVPQLWIAVVVACIAAILALSIGSYRYAYDSPPQDRSTDPRPAIENRNTVHEH